MHHYEPLPADFFNRSTVQVAEELLGHLLIRRLNEETLVGKIVEVEAYLGSNDLAAHAVAGITVRTKILFEEAGLAYIFRMRAYHCLNVVTEEIGNPSCVLIRAVEPISGIEQMKINRGNKLKRLSDVTNGPGKLCQALKINMIHYGMNLTSSESALFLAFGEKVDNKKIEKSPRIGISKDTDKLFRFTIHNNSFLSR